MSDEQMHYQASLILLLEKQYKQAYFHLPFVTLDEAFKRFEKSLYNYSPYRYEMLYHKDKTYSLNYVQGGVRPDIFGELGQRDGFAGVVGARAGDDGNAFVDLLDADADSGFMLVVGHRGGFAGGAAGHEAVDALFDLPFDEFTVIL